MGMKTSKSTAAKPKRPAKPRTKKAAIAVVKKTTRRIRKKPAAAPTQEEIALRAYFISEERQRRGLPGSHEDDWLEAERQLKAGT